MVRITELTLRLTCPLPEARGKPCHSKELWKVGPAISDSAASRRTKANLRVEVLCRPFGSRGLQGNGMRGAPVNVLASEFCGSDAPARNRPGGREIGVLTLGRPETGFSSHGPQDAGRIRRSSGTRRICAPAAMIRCDWRAGQAPVAPPSAWHAATKTSGRNAHCRRPANALGEIGASPCICWSFTTTTMGV